MRARSVDEVIGVLRSCERERRVVLLKAALFGEGDDKRPAEPARKPRKPTLASVAKQASKAAIAVARYEVKPDGTVVVVTGASEQRQQGNELDEWIAKHARAPERH